MGYKKNSPAICIVILAFLLQSCSNTPKSTSVKPFYFEIYFGKTGGFTNLNPIFEIKSNGEILRSNNAKSPFYILKKTEKSTIDSIYNLVVQCNFSTLNIKQVANMTNYIEFKSEKLNNKVTWFDDSQIPEDLKKLHLFLLNKIN